VHGLVFSGLTDENAKILSYCLNKLDVSLKHKNGSYFTPTHHVMKVLSLCRQVRVSDVAALYQAAHLSYSLCLRLSIYQLKPMRAEIDEYFYINQMEQLEAKLIENGVTETHALVQLIGVFKQEIIYEKESRNAGFSLDTSLFIINKAVQLLQHAEKFASELTLTPGLRNYLQSLALITLPHCQLSSISETLANHFSSLVDHGLLVRLEKQGLKFCCVLPDNEKLFKLFNGYGFILGQEHAIDSVPVGFQQYQSAIIFPHPEVENLLKLAQYDPNQIVDILEDFYKSQGLDEYLFCVGEHADLSKSLVSQSCYSWNI
jgi:hypothetical protein